MTTRRAQVRAGFEERNGLQFGDPAKFAEAIVRLADEPSPPMRSLAGTVAVNAAEEKLHLSYDRMASLLASYDNPEALDIATNLDMKVEDLLRRAAA